MPASLESRDFFADWGAKPLCRLLAALGSGVLLACCFPRPDIGWLVFIAPAPLLWALRFAQRPRQAAFLGFLTGLSFFGLHLMWVRVIGEIPYTALSIHQALYLALFGYAAFWAMKAPSRALSLASLWALIEWVRSLGMFGTCWGDLAVAFHNMPLFLVLLPLLGQFLCGGLPILLAEGFLSLVCGKWRPFAWTLGLLLVLFLLSGGSGAWRPRRGEGISAPFRALILQTGSDWGRAEAMISNLPQPDPWPRLSLMGEGILTERGEKQLRVDPWVYPAFQAGSSWLLAGQPVKLLNGESLNAAVLYAPQGWATGFYGKTRPLPFAEWLPHPIFDPIVRQYAPDMKYFARGEALHPLLIAIARTATPEEIKKSLREKAGTMSIGALICFESAVPQLSYKLCREGASFLAVLSSNETIQETAGAEQHLAHDQIRAAECDRAVLRCANTGISAHISPGGRIVQKLDIGKVDYLEIDDVGARGSLTVAVRVNNWLLLIPALILAANFFIHLRQKLHRDAGAGVGQLD